LRILNDTITTKELHLIAKDSFGDLVKAVVDLDRKIVAIDAELHSDLEALCLENGSRQWGINYYPKIDWEDFIEFKLDF